MVAGSNHMPRFDVPKVDVVQWILDSFTVDDFVVLKMDVEGAELEVLRSIDFARTAFGVLLVECDGQNARKDLAVRMLLQSKGYTWTRSFGRSWWFVNNQFAQVYSEFM